MFPISSNNSDEISQLYVDDVFSTYLYTGNGATQDINNGIALHGYNFKEGSTFYFDDSASNVSTYGVNSIAFDGNGNKYCIIASIRLLKLNSANVIVWQTVLGRGGGVMCYSSAGNCLYIGGTADSDNTAAIHKVSTTDGSIIFTLKCPKVGVYYRYADYFAYSNTVDVKADLTGGVIALSHHTELDGSNNLKVFPVVSNYDSSGTRIWSTIITENSYSSGASKIIVDATGNIFVGLQGASYQIITKVNSSGSIVWSSGIDDVSDNTFMAQTPNFFTVASDGCVYGVGYNASDTHNQFWKLNADGTFGWARSFVNYHYQRYYTFLTSDAFGNVCILGNFTQYSSLPMYIVKINSAGTSIATMKAADDAGGSLGFNYYDGGFMTNGDQFVFYGNATTTKSYKNTPAGSFPFFVSFSQSMTDTVYTNLMTILPNESNIQMSDSGNSLVRINVYIPTNHDITFSATTTAGTSTPTALLRNYTFGGSVSGGGLVWIKTRSPSDDNELIDTIRGRACGLQSNTTYAQNVNGSEKSLSSFNIDGFSLGSNDNSNVNENGASFVSWTFRKAPKFFDIVTWTGDGSASRQIAHNLGVMPGMVIIKSTDILSNWVVYHRSATGDLALNSNSNQYAYRSVSANESVIYTAIGGADTGLSNGNGHNYVAYLYAHDPSPNGIIQCGSYVGGMTTTTVTYYSNTTAIVPTGVTVSLYGTGGSRVNNPYVSSYNFSQVDVVPTMQLSDTLAFSGTSISGYPSNISAAKPSSITATISWPQFTVNFVVVYSGSTSATFNLIGDGSYNNGGFSINVSTSTGNRGCNFSSSGFRYDSPVYTDSYTAGTNATATLNGTTRTFTGEPAIGGATYSTQTIDSGSATSVSLVIPSGGSIQVSYSVGGTTTVDLGWEPQYVMIKSASTSGLGWTIIDNMRGMPVGSSDSVLYADSASTEVNNQGGLTALTPTGFSLESASSLVNNSGTTYIYMAIRRPNKPPTSGMQVYKNYSLDSGSVSSPYMDFADLVINTRRSENYGKRWADRLRGLGLVGNTGYFLNSTTTDSETAYTATTSAGTILENLFSQVNNGLYATLSGWSGGIAHFFKRAPGFFDIVCYTGNNVSGRAVNHNLGVSPELIIVKSRSGVASWYSYCAYSNSTNPQNYFLILNTNDAKGLGAGVFGTLPTNTYFYVGTSGDVNLAPSTYVAYLFATLAGISKVGSYTGNGSTQPINCGFSMGARFIMIKRTDQTGDWYIWDTARGITSSNDPHLSLNTTAAEVTTDNSIDTDTSGFRVIQTSATNINVTSATYIFLAIA